MSEALRYPTGRFQYQEGDADARARALDALREFPTALREVAADLTERQLATPYREGGWTARQVIHHVADSHVNAYVRTHWLLTEERPTIKAYDEKAWAELPDSLRAPLGPTLDLLDALHARWTTLLDWLPEDAYARELVHPVSGPMSLDKLVQMYAWHGRHHLGHLRIVLGGEA